MPKPSDRAKNDEGVVPSWSPSEPPIPRVQLSELVPANQVYVMNPAALHLMDDGDKRVFIAAHPATWARLSEEQKLEFWRKSVARLDLGGDD